MSVFNGFQGLIEELFSNFDPQLQIISTTDKVFSPDDSRVKEACQFDGVIYAGEVLQENALLSFRDKQMPIVVKGVTETYASINNIDSILVRGEYKTKQGSFHMCICGIGLASKMGCNVHVLDPLEIYVPKRLGRVNLVRPETSFNREYAFIAGSFMVQQEKYDNNYLIVSMEMARALFEYKTEVSSIELKLAPGINEDEIEADLQAILGSDFEVKNRYEQQEEVYKMMRIEKWITYLILLCILLIAIFNIIGSLSMLIIDKQKDIIILKSMGARRKDIFYIFLFEGWLIALIGAIIGLLIGIFLCYLQMTYGLISMGTAGTFIINAYPVKIQLTDIMLIFVSVASLGLLASAYPAKQLLKNK